MGHINSDDSAILASFPSHLTGVKQRCNLVSISFPRLQYVHPLALGRGCNPGEIVHMTTNDQNQSDKE